MWNNPDVYVLIRKWFVQYKISCGVVLGEREWWDYVNDRLVWDGWLNLVSNGGLGLLLVFVFSLRVFFLVLRFPPTKKRRLKLQSNLETLNENLFYFFTFAFFLLLIFNFFFHSLNFFPINFFGENTVLLISCRPKQTKSRLDIPMGDRRVCKWSETTIEERKVT